MSPKRGDTDEFGQKTLWVSWSRLYEWSSCQQKSVLKLQGKADKVKDGRRFLHGTLADRAVTRWLKQDTPHEQGQMETYVDELWEEHAIKSPEYKIEWKGDPQEDMAKVRNLAKKVVRNVEPFLFARVLPYEFQPDWRFEVPIKVPTVEGNMRTIVLNGAADIVVRDPATGLVSIYDLKATENEKYVHQGIMPQLTFYSVAWTIIMGQQPKDTTAAFLTPACKLQYHELKIGSQDRRHLMSRIVNFAQFTWSTQTPTLTDDSQMCFFCECKKFCPRFATVMGEGNKVSLAATGAQRAANKRSKPNEQSRGN